jgi:hypothetical protein
MPFIIPIATAGAAAAATAGSAVAAAAVPLTLAGAGLSAYMSVQQGKEQQKLAENAADTEMALANREAQRIENENRYEQEQRLRERDLVLGKIRRSYGRSGLAMTGSPLDDQIETAKNLTMDKIMSNYNATERAKSVRYQGEATASIYRQQGKAAKTTGYWQAGQSIFGGLTTASKIKRPQLNRTNYSLRLE